MNDGVDTIVDACGGECMFTPDLDDLGAFTNYRIYEYFLQIICVCWLCQLDMTSLRCCSSKYNRPEFTAVHFCEQLIGFLS